MSVGAETSVSLKAVVGAPLVGKRSSEKTSAWEIGGGYTRSCEGGKDRLYGELCTREGRTCTGRWRVKLKLKTDLGGGVSALRCNFDQNYHLVFTCCCYRRRVTWPRMARWRRRKRRKNCRRPGL